MEEKKYRMEAIMDVAEPPIVKSQACSIIMYDEAEDGKDPISMAKDRLLKYESNKKECESEKASIEAIAKIAKLSNDEKEIFTKMSLGHDNDINETVKKEIKRKIKDVFEKPENIVEALRYIHDTWCRNHGDNFQKIKDDGTKRDRDYQFTDLLLMSFDNDGAFADLMFIRPMLEFCGVEYNEPKIKEAFSKKRKEFLKENGITNRDALKDFIKKGSKSYDALTELQGFNNIPIDTYVMENARLEEVFKTLNEEEHELEGGMQGAVTLKDSIVGSGDGILKTTISATAPGQIISALPKQKTSIWSKIVSKIKSFFGKEKNSDYIKTNEHYKKESEKRWKEELQNYKDEECDEKGNYLSIGQNRDEYLPNGMSKAAYIDAHKKEEEKF